MSNLTDEQQKRERAARLQAEHEQFLREMRLGTAMVARKHASNAGAGSHTERDNMRIRVNEDNRIRQLQEEAQERAQRDANAAALATAKQQLEAERAKKAAKRNKKKKKAKKESGGGAGSTSSGCAPVTDGAANSDDEEEEEGEQ